MLGPWESSGHTEPSQGLVTALKTTSIQRVISVHPPDDVPHVGTWRNYLFKEFALRCDAWETQDSKKQALSSAQTIDQREKVGGSWPRATQLSKRKERTSNFTFYF